MGLANGAQPVFFLAAHSGLGLMESAMPFLERGSKVFLYRWNIHSTQIRDYFAATNAERVETFDMSLSTLVAEIDAEEREIVILMTASPTYEFGAAQLTLYKILRAKFPRKIVDIYQVGHCMYGCTSHAHDDACNFPVSYSRYVRESLPYDAASVLNKYFNDGGGPEGGILKTFVCPSYSWNDTSYAKTSMLSNFSSIDVLGEFRNEAKAKICVKFHPICYGYNRAEDDVDVVGSAHPFLSIPPQDEAGLRRMMRTLPTVPAEETSALPFLESCDVAVCDLFSSMTFEALYFHPRIHVLAFAGEQISQFTPDPNILALVHTFSDGRELRRLLELAAEGQLERKTLPDGSHGRDFFKAKYREPDGEEASKVGRIRRWNGYGADGEGADKIDEKNAVVNGDAETVVEVDQLVVEYQATIIFPTKLEMMVTGKTVAEIEEDLLDNPVRRFVEDHRLQLRSMNLPKILWQRLFIKVHREIFDAGDKFQIQRIVVVDDDDVEDDKKGGGYRVVALEDLDVAEDVFLVDHAMTWTNEEEAAKMLLANPRLLERVEALVGIDGVEEVESERSEDDNVLAGRVAKLVDALRDKADSYALGRSGVEQKINFLNDEFGSKIRRVIDDNDDEGDDDDERNVRFKVFFFVYQGIAFSVFWPAKRIQEEDEVVR